MTFKRVRIKETVYVNTGGTPGSSTTSDSIGLYARVQLADTITTTATDSLAFYARVGLADSNAAQSDTVGLYAKVNLADTAPAQSDLLTALRITGSEVNPTPDDVLNDINLGLGNEINPAPSDLVKAGISGGALTDVSSPPSDARSASVRTWAGSQTTSGQAPTNPANAVGQQDGTVATVQGSGALVGGNASTLTLSIPVASIPPGSTARILRVYATVATGLAGGTATYTNTGGNPTGGSIPLTTTSPVDITLVTIGSALTVTFTSQAGLLGTNVYTVDAVAVVTPLNTF
jgi:hypothetical protein